MTKYNYLALKHEFNRIKEAKSIINLINAEVNDERFTENLQSVVTNLEFAKSTLGAVLELAEEIFVHI